MSKVFLLFAFFSDVTVSGRFSTFEGLVLSTRPGACLSSTFVVKLKAVNRHNWMFQVSSCVSRELYPLPIRVVLACNQGYDKEVRSFGLPAVSRGVNLALAFEWRFMALSAKRKMNYGLHG